MPSPSDLGSFPSTAPSRSESPAGHRGPAPDIKQSTQLCSHSHSWEPVSLHAILGLIKPHGPFRRFANLLLEVTVITLSKGARAALLAPCCHTLPSPETGFRRSAENTPGAKPKPPLPGTKDTAGHCLHFVV